MKPTVGVQYLAIIVAAKNHQKTILIANSRLFRCIFSAEWEQPFYE